MNFSSTRRILHVDMDAFFAAVEQQCNPRLQGKPVAVIGSNRRTVITTASYEARRFGIKTGMTLSEAKKLCPQLIMVTGNNKKYTDISTQLISIYKNYTPLVEVFSVDEAFLDITGSLKLFGGEEKIALLLKEEIREKLGLTCSIGIAPNKLLAKLASDQQKPDGLMILKPEEVPSLLAKLPVKELCGIGPSLEKSLAAMGIKTCGELGSTDPVLLKKKFGVMGEKLYLMGMGIDDSPVVPLEEEKEIKSVGHSMTLEEDTWDKNLLSLHILKLSEMVGRRLRSYGYQGRTVTLTLRYADFTTFSRQETLSAYIFHTPDIYKVALQILSSIPLAQKVRLLGVSISNLNKKFLQLCLFERERKKALVTPVMDKINEKYGEFTLTWGTLLRCSRYSPIISPAWQPERRN